MMQIATAPMMQNGYPDMWAPIVLCGIILPSHGHLILEFPCQVFLLVFEPTWGQSNLGVLSNTSRCHDSLPRLKPVGEIFASW